MKSLRLIPNLLNPLVIVALLAGCGGAQSDSLPQSTSGFQSRAYQASGSYGDLLYIVSVPYLTIMSYPQGKVVARISGDYGNSTLCSDHNTGNVFVSNETNINEYAHGGTTPVATLTPPPGQYLGQCAVDPTTGDLAVSTFNQTGPPGVLIWPNAQGSAVFYPEKKFRAIDAPVYDGSGDLYLNGANKSGIFRLVELAAGHTDFKVIQYPLGGFDFRVYPPGSFQWDGKYLVFIENEYSGYGNGLYQLQVTGDKSKIVSEAHLLNEGFDRAFVLDYGSLLGFYKREERSNNYAVASWHYPKGGKPFSHFYGVKNGPYSNRPQLTLSIEPSQ
jgi:hypothetical protein